jgi:hypothetical protein
VKPGSIEMAAIKLRASRRLLDNEDTLLEFASLLLHGRIDRVISLFTEEAIVTEPFSKFKTLHGKAQIQDFLKVARSLMKGMQCKIRISHNLQLYQRQITAFFIFSSGHSEAIQIKIKFASEDPVSPHYYKISSLDVSIAD